LRIGIGRRDPAVREITGHVLGKFGADEKDLFAQVLAKAGEQIGCWLGAGIQKAMSQFNGPVNSQPQQKDKP
jgi:peptidyl-tRNA hydrolase